MQRATILQELTSHVILTFLDGEGTDLESTTPLLEWGILNSLAITRLLNFIQRQFHVILPPEKVIAEHFETLDALTDLILATAQTEAGDARLATERPAEPGETREIPLSPGQERLWFLWQLEPGQTAYNEYIALRLTGPLNIPALEWSIGEVARRHESLRTFFPQSAGRPAQRVLPWQPVTLPLVNLYDVPLLIREAQVIRLAEEHIREPFALDQPPLWRGRLYQVEADDYLLLLVFHHMVVDGWSMGVFYRELAALYAARCSGSPVSLPDLSIQYADFARWQQRLLQKEELQVSRAYWEKQLTEATFVLELPTDRTRPPAQTYQGAHLSFSLSAQLTQALRAVSRREGVTVFMILFAAFQLLLARYSGQEDFLIGTPVANRNRTEFESLIGFLVNMLALRADLSGTPTLRELLRRVRSTVSDAYIYQDLPFEHLVSILQPERDLSRSPLFQVMFNMQELAWVETQLAGLEVQTQDLERGSAKYDLTLAMVDGQETLYGVIEYCTDLFEHTSIERMVEHFRALLQAMLTDLDQSSVRVSMLTATERESILHAWNDTVQPYADHTCLAMLFEEQVARSPRDIALIYEEEQLTYAELNSRANQLAHHLRLLGVGPEVMVGLCVERSVPLVVGLLGILKAGGAYIPLDPNYPQERLAFMAADSQIHLILTQQALVEKCAQLRVQLLCLDTDWPTIALAPVTDAASGVASHNLAYVMYTSGSTGKPRGVMVTQRNVLNFLAGIDQLPGMKQGTWLAVTSISFDISILELLWTLVRGFKVVLLAHRDGLPLLRKTRGKSTAKPMAFSLFYFANNDETMAGAEKYRLLLEGAKFADQHGFSAVWTPERHFHPFGGLYPNPSVTAAALAAITQSVEIRAGSVVLPLHHPVRVAEEWSVVDNLSQGRVSISFATGWQANDFVLAPENYYERKQIMVREIETVRNLWRGESIALRNGLGQQVEVRIFPRPLQSELPIWITTGGSAETFQLAGELGANLLTHLLGQTVPELGKKISLYREARARAGYDPAAGRVALMLHTFVGLDKDEVLNTVRQPFLAYLKSSFSLIRDLTRSLGQDIENLSADDIDALLTYAFNRYYHTNSLIGTPESCLELVEQLKSINVDEIACLVDFGIETEAVLHSLQYVNLVREQSNRQIREDHEPASFVEQVQRHQVTHLQCTPSLASLFSQDEEILAGMRSVRKLLLGGEALSSSLATRLGETLGAEISNMYGPTETTIWSTTHSVSSSQTPPPIGHPLANTRVYILDRHLQPVPVGVPGELYIAGDGLARGYLQQPVYTAERFVPDSFSRQPGGRMYRTGDLAHYRMDGAIEFLGRADQQVKIRGARIEPGEVEYVLEQHPAVERCSVLSIEETPGSSTLMAYIVTRAAQTISPEELRRYMLDKLPQYMLPVAFLQVESLPLTPNGKVDRRRLSRVATNLPEERYQAPRTPLEETLARLWAEVLGRERVGITDHFFHLGGHSLLATQLISRVNAAIGSIVPLRYLFEAPTVAGFIERMLEQELALVDDDLLEQMLEDIEESTQYSSTD